MISIHRLYFMISLKEAYEKYFICFRRRKKCLSVLDKAVKISARQGHHSFTFSQSWLSNNTDQHILENDIEWLYSRLISLGYSTERSEDVITIRW